MSSTAAPRLKTHELIEEPQVLVGHCGGVFMIPEKHLGDYYAGYGVVGAIATGIALIGGILHALVG